MIRLSFSAAYPQAAIKIFTPSIPPVLCRASFPKRVVLSRRSIGYSFATTSRGPARHSPRLLYTYLFVVLHVAPSKRMPSGFFIGIFSSGNRKRTHAVESTTATADHQSPLSLFRSKTRWYSSWPNVREKREITPRADLQKIIRLLINRARGCVEVGVAHFSTTRRTFEFNACNRSLGQASIDSSDAIYGNIFQGQTYLV